MTIKTGDKIKSDKWEMVGVIFTVVETCGGGCVSATCDATPRDTFEWFFCEGDYEKVYTTPEGAIVSIGDKGVWKGIEYTLVEGPDHYDVDQPYWKGQGYSWNNLPCKGYTVIPKETKQTKEEPSMTTMFTETTTVTKIKEVIDAANSDLAHMSVVPYNDTYVRVVVGAEYQDRFRSFFSKEGLTELIEELTAVRDCM